MNRILLGLVVACLLSIGLMGCSDVDNKKITEKNTYPANPIHIIVPFSAGGMGDLQARSLEKFSTQYTNEQPFVVMNKPGSAGKIAWDELIKAEPNGYTIGITDIGILLQPIYQSKYHYPTALEPIAQISTSSFVMAVNANQPWNNVQDVIQYAKQNQIVLKYGHAGIGSGGHIIGEVFAKDAQIKLEQVPFRGTTESLNALLGEHVQIIFAPPTAIEEHLKAGKLKVLAISGEERSVNADLSSIPTFKEQGLDIVLTNWNGLAVSKNVPIEVRNDLEKLFKKIILNPEFKKEVESLGVEFKYLDIDESRKVWDSDSDRLKRMIDEAGILGQIQSLKK